MAKSSDVKLTVKQAKFFKEYLKDGNGTRAAKVAYNVKDDNSASSLAYETLRKLENPMRSLMESMGITAMDLIKTTDEARLAEKWNDFTGEKEADHTTRLKAVSLMLKMAGYEEKREAPQVNIQNNVLNSIGEDKDKYDIK